MRLLHRRRLERDAGKARVAALEGDVLFRPELANQFEGLVRARAALFDRHATGLELLRKLAANSDAHVVAPIGGDVEHCGLLGQHHRVIQRQQHDRAHQLDLFCRASSHRQRDKRVRHRPMKHHMLAASQIVVAEPLGQSRELTYSLDRGQCHAEFDRCHRLPPDTPAAAVAAQLKMQI
jgi:hypothetical protein